MRIASFCTAARSALPVIPLGLTLGLGAGLAAAEEGQVVITTTAADGKTTSTTIVTIPGHPTQVTVNGTVITTSTTSQSVRTANGSDMVLTASPTPMHTDQNDTVPSRWDLDWFSGLHFGGIIGASIDNALTYDLHGSVMPELTADVGISGATVGLGARWSLSAKQWSLSSKGLSFDYDSYSAIAVRAIGSYRWDDHDRSPSFWHGMPGNGGWYRGGEVEVMVEGLAVVGQVTWTTTHRDPGPHYTLSYGFGF